MDDELRGLVKPLEWTSGPYPWKAETAFSDGTDECSSYVVEFDEGEASWGVWPPGCTIDPLSWHKSQDAAFAAAQANYAARILAALDPSELTRLRADLAAALAANVQLVEREEKARWLIERGLWIKGDGADAARAWLGGAK